MQDIFYLSLTARRLPIFLKKVACKRGTLLGAGLYIYLRRVTNAKVIPSDNVAPQYRILVMDIGQKRQVRRTDVEMISGGYSIEAALRDENVNLHQPVPGRALSKNYEQIRAQASTVLGTTKSDKKFNDK